MSCRGPCNENISVLSKDNVAGLLVPMQASTNRVQRCGCTHLHACLREGTS